jgi:Cu+-exporting ATPase
VLTIRLENADFVDSVIMSLESLPGVIGVTFPYPHSHLLFSHTPTLTSLRTIVDTLATAYPHLTFLPTSTHNNSQVSSLQKHKETQRWKRTFLASLCFALPNFFVGMMSMYLPHWLMGWTMWKLFTGIYLGDLVCLALTIPVQTWLARRFYENAYKSLKHGAATM